MKQEPIEEIDDEQVAHDQWLLRQSDDDLRRLARGLNRLMRERDAATLRRQGTAIHSGRFDEAGAVERAARRHACLTSAEAQEIAEAFGF